MKNIMVVVSTLYHFNFFNKLEAGLRSKGYCFIYLTCLKSVYDSVKKREGSVYKISPSFNPNIELSDRFTSSSELLSGQLRIPDAEKLYRGTVECVRKILNLVPLDFVFFWNGSTVKDIAVKDAIADLPIRTYYFEIANLPGKMVVDPLGVNASSSIFNDRGVLQRYSNSTQTFEAWRKEYLREKQKKHVVHQASQSKLINIYYIIDWLGFAFFSFARDTNFSFIVKLWKKIINKRVTIKYDDFNIDSGGYCFFPLQVNSDTQLLVNSDIGNLEAIRVASEYSSSKGLKLLIKPHPAEPDQTFFKQIYKLQEELEFKIVNGNTMKIIMNAELVITINSTVGLEALIMNKPVMFLGRSQFKDFSQQDLADYICGYLVNIDFFNKGSIIENGLREIIKVIEN